MRSLFLAMAASSAVAISYILLAWVFSPKLSQMEKNHRERVGALQGSPLLRDRSNLALEYASFFLIRRRSKLLLTFAAIFVVSIFALAN